MLSLVEKALEKAYEKDFSEFFKLNEIIKNPYTKQNIAENYEKPIFPAIKNYQTFCGT